MVLSHLHPNIRRTLVGFAEPAPNLIASLLSFNDEETYKAATRVQGLPDSILWCLATHPDRGIRKSLASYQKHLPDEILVRLAEDDSPIVASALAANSGLSFPRKVKETLAGSPSASVRSLMAARETTDLGAFLRDKSPQVRLYAMMNSLATNDQLVEIRDNPEEVGTLRALAQTALLDRSDR